VGAVFGVTVEQQPALIAAGAIVAIAMSQLLLQAASLLSSKAFLARAVGLSAVVCTAYFALHALFEHALVGSVLPLRDAAGAFQWTLSVVIVGIFLALLVLQHVFRYVRSPLTEAVYMHLYNGLYIDVYITRLLQRVWPSPLPRALATARSHGG
jgi:NAD(P)H-quinone oxidoreductase subunit 5